MNGKNLMESKRKETLEAIEKLCLLDDNLMTPVFNRNIEATELLLNVILQRNDLKVLEVRYLSSVDMFYPVLARQVKYFKKTEGGQKIMCQIFEDLAEKRAEEARIEEKKAFALRMIARGKLPVEEIAEDADLPIEVVRDLAGLQLY